MFKHLPTFFLTFILVISVNISHAQLNGTYTIGTSGSEDYTDITSAVADLTTNGLSGDVVFSIAAGDYSEKITIGTYAGSADYTVRFVGQGTLGEVTVGSTTLANGEGVFFFDGAENVELNNLTISGTGGGLTSTLILLDNQATNILIDNCMIGRTDDTGSLVYAPYNFNGEVTSLTISNNAFFGGYRGIDLNGNISGDLAAISIQGNLLYDVESIAIRVATGTNITISDNEITATVDASNSDGDAGIYIVGCDDFYIYNNVILSHYGYAIDVDYCQATAGTIGTVYNNFFVGKGLPGEVTVGVVSLTQSSNIMFINNSIRKITNGSDFVKGTFIISSVEDCLLANNIIVTDSDWAIYIDDASTITSQSNDIYAAGNYIARTDVNLATLADWQTATGHDSESISVMPDFAGEADLHTATVALDGKAMPVTGITTDIDGEARDASTPDIGADEFVISNYPPVIEDQEFSINENSAAGSSIGTVVATNAEVGESISFSIIAGNDANLVDINSETGEITLVDSSTFNYEEQTEFNFTVQAEDEATLTGSATVTIMLNDVNDAPIVESTGFSIKENRTSGAIMGTVLASDEDAGQTISYALETATDTAFNIDAVTGEITVTDTSLLNYETNQTLVLTVLVSDDANTPLVTEAEIILTIEDENDAPEASNQTFRIAEDTPASSVIDTIEAFNEDEGQGLYFEIVAGNDAGVFDLATYTGVLSLSSSASINYETISAYQLTVEVSDDVYPYKITTITITIEVLDINEKPELSDATFSIDENTANGTEVGQLTASDPDNGQALSYSITNGNTDNAFAIDASTGAISVNNSSALDYETTPQFLLSVSVTDDGENPLSASAQIVINLNDVANETNNLSTLKIESLAIYPNPTQDAITIDLPVGVSSAFVEVYDVAGNMQVQKADYNGEDKIELPQPVGVYLLLIRFDGHTFTKQIVKK